MNATAVRQGELNIGTDLHQRQLMAKVIRRHHRLYRGFARKIMPDLRDWRSVWERAAFAILTANTDVNTALTGLRRATRHLGFPPSEKRGLSITPERVRYVNALPQGEQDVYYLLKQGPEPWHEYRLRLARTVEGLGITKASYLAGLLYPLACEVACLDTWMLKALGIARQFQSISMQSYLDGERQLRLVAGVANLSLAQWIIWDWIRRRGPNPQDFFVWCAR